MSDRVRLILLSFLMLFVELVLIRWLGSNIVFLSYFTNFVLLGSFLGIGLGFLRANRERDLFPYAIVGLALLVAFVWIFLAQVRINPSEIPKYFRSPGETGLPIWIVLPVVFTAVAAVMTMIGEGVARTFKRFEPLEAYRLDILGSILGIACFSLMSFLSASPILWGLVVVALVVGLSLPRVRWYQLASIAVLLVVLGMQSFGGQLWSPYYRIEVHKDEVGIDRVYVNGRPHQFLTTNAVLAANYPLYWLPYRTRADATPPKDVLVIGAGTGLDASVALSENVGHVDVVEIDPEIYQLGVEKNPEHPYDDPRVSAYLTDGRAYLENTDKKYDVIIFSVPDSLTLISGNASVRLESYLLTKEAIQSSKEHLKPGGTFVLSSFFRELFVADRIAETLREVFGTAPCRAVIGSGGREDVFIASDDPSAIVCPSPEVWQASATTPAPVTDDRPFAYIEKATIPGFYLASLALLLLVSVGAIRVASGPINRMRPYTDLFFMGAAFLLLETKNVVQFALLFGSTWFVNALVFGGVLVTVLAAIEVAKRVELKHPGRIYAALFVALGATWLLPNAWLLSLPYLVRVVIAIVVAFTPVFLANLVFARRFRDVGGSTVAFGANLLGAMVGAMLEYGALMIGYRGLTLMAAALYGFAWAFGARHLASEVDSGAPEVTGEATPVVTSS